MPLQVYLEEPGKPTSVVHIGRLAGGTSPDSINTYSVVYFPAPQVKTHPFGHYTPCPTNQEWDTGDKFEHRYGDGVEVCVQKALEVLIRNRRFQ